MEAMEELMKAVYGDADASSFPRPLPKDEAGQGKTGQRRYLWTDAFGVLNYVTLAHRAKENGDQKKREMYLQAAKKLVYTVTECLGTPSSEEYPMKLDKESKKYVGMRIGKTETKIPSDPGMDFDGMYWHYIDKWLFALARYSVEAKDSDVLKMASDLATTLHPYFCVKNKGMRWKLSVNADPIPALGSPVPSGDALSALIVYGVIKDAGGDIKPEMFADLRTPATVHIKHLHTGYFRDPLGYGLQAWEAQWVSESKGVRKGIHQALASAAHYALDAQAGMSLPFRFYGGLMGGMLLDDKIREYAEALISKVALPFEMKTKCGEVEHSGINKVMLASAVDTWAWKKLGNENELDLDI